MHCKGLGCSAINRIVLASRFLLFQPCSPCLDVETLWTNQTTPFSSSVYRAVNDLAVFHRKGNSDWFVLNVDSSRRDNRLVLELHGTSNVISKGVVILKNYDTWLRFLDAAVGDGEIRDSREE